MSHLTRGAFALAILSTLVLPHVVAAQQPGVREAAQLEADNQQADRYLSEAVALQSDMSSWVKAAKLYARSANLRAYGDLRAHAAYSQAGTLLYYKGKSEEARQMFDKAGRRALEAGRPYEASLAFLSAAELVARHGAQPLNEKVSASHYRQLALRLSESPVLTEEQRADVRSRTRA